MNVQTGFRFLGPLSLSLSLFSSFALRFLNSFSLCTNPFISFVFSAIDQTLLLSHSLIGTRKVDCLEG